MVDYLVKAQQVTKEVAPMNWMFLDAPPDGTVLLVWQPLMQLQTRFASDGYVWADAEQSFCQEYRGYVRSISTTPDCDYADLMRGRMWKCIFTEVAIIQLMKPYRHTVDGDIG